MAVQCGWLRETPLSPPRAFDAANRLKLALPVVLSSAVPKKRKRGRKKKKLYRPIGADGWEGNCDFHGSPPLKSQIVFTRSRGSGQDAWLSSTLQMPCTLSEITGWFPHGSMKKFCGMPKTESLLVYHFGMAGLEEDKEYWRGVSERQQRRKPEEKGEAKSVQQVKKRRSEKRRA